MNLDAGAHPGPMGNQSPHAPPLPQPTTPPSGGRVGRCTYGWPLPCLLDYCSAGPQVAAAAPPYFPPLWLGSWHLGCFWLGGGGALRLVCQVLEDFPSSGTVGHHKKNIGEGGSGKGHCGRATILVSVYRHTPSDGRFSHHMPQISLSPQGLSHRSVHGRHRKVSETIVDQVT